MNFRFFIGVDVSKLTLDVALIDSEQPDQIQHIQISNDTAGINQMLKWMGNFAGFDKQQALFCMEHTGLYNYPLLAFLSTHQLNVWVESAIQIKRTMGMQRGKNDKVDAMRIAQYAFRNNMQMRLWHPAREVVEKIKHLNALRDRLVETKRRLITPVDEFRKYGNQTLARLLQKSMNKSIKAIDSDLANIEEQIRETIDGDDDLKRLFALITSVVGIGFVTAVNLIIHTNEFKLFSNVRQLACYCGVAPFEHRSGTSVRGRSRVSHLANKKLKTNLHMASLTGVKLDIELKRYYERKVAEGKSKMSVLNAVRNKLLARVFAVVQRGYAYQRKYSRNDLVMS